MWTEWVALVVAVCVVGLLVGITSRYENYERSRWCQTCGHLVCTCSDACE